MSRSYVLENPERSLFSIFLLEMLCYLSQEIWCLLMGFSSTVITSNVTNLPQLASLISSRRDHHLKSTRQSRVDRTLKNSTRSSYPEPMSLKALADFWSPLPALIPATEKS